MHPTPCDPHARSDSGQKKRLKSKSTSESVDQAVQAASKVKLGSVPLARACGLMAKARARRANLLLPTWQALQCGPAEDSTARPGKPSNQVSGPSEAEAEAAKAAEPWTC